MSSAAVLSDSALVHDANTVSVPYSIMQKGRALMLKELHRAARRFTLRGVNVKQTIVL